MNAATGGGPAAARTPARGLGEAPAESVDDPYAKIAVRALSGMLAGLGLAFVLAALLQRAVGHANALAQARLLLGTGLLLGGGLAFEIGRRGHRHLSATVGLTIALAAIALHAWHSGLGEHSLALGAVVLLIVAAGILVDLRVAIALAALDVALVAGFERAEGLGRMHGAAALDQFEPGLRTLACALIAAFGLFMGWIVRRQLSGNVARAREQERRMSRLLRLGSDFTWETDTRGRFVYLSPAFETHALRSPLEFLQAGLAGGPEIVHDAQWELLRDDMRARRPYRNRVIHFVCHDGTDLFLDGSGEPSFDAGGRLTGWWGVSRNATVEMLAQRELQRSQAMLDRLVRLSPDAICVSSLRSGRVLLANPAFLQLAGIPEAEVLGRNGFELGLWRDAESMLALGRAIGVQGWVRDFRSRAWSRDGAEHVVLITAAAFDWDGEDVAVITTRDITALERARQEGDAILDNAVVGVCLVRGDLLVRVNPQLERMLGRPVGSLVGQRAEVLFPDRERLHESEALDEERQAAGETIDVERRVQRADGSAILLRLRGRAVDARRHRETGTIWVIEDVTERRRSEIELAEAKRDAEAASLAKSRFLATMSHEIRTPLSGVLGLARLLQAPALEDARRGEYLVHLVDAAEQLNGIVSDVLDLSRIEAGHVALERIPFDLHALVLSAFRTFAPLGRERGLEMHCEVAEGAPREVVGDPGRVRQIVTNYLSNALKFTDRGAIAVRLSARAGGLARVEVHDSGIGVPPDLRDQLFLPFTQVDSSTTRRFGGSGLGLSICRELAQLMGGEVGIDDASGAGSCFWVELPLARASDDDLSTLAGVLEEPPQPLAGMRVLLAEDNPVNRLIVGAMLARLGADVIEAEDGAEAITQARRLVPALHAVLMDLHMPEVDGLEATRRLRALPETTRLPIIALSAAVLDAERAQAQAAGMNSFVAKPAGEADLLKALWPFAPVGAGNS